MRRPCAAETAVVGCPIHVLLSVCRAQSGLAIHGHHVLYVSNALPQDSHIPPIVADITSWFRGDGRALLRHVSSAVPSHALPEAYLCGNVSEEIAHFDPQADYTERFRVTFDFKNLARCPVDGFLVRTCISSRKSARRRLPWSS